MKLTEFFHKELIVTKLEAKSKEEVFEILYRKLLENGYVKESFLEGIINREKTFPTGLLLNGNNVAIPHTDAEHVLKPAIAVATLCRPVVFKNMANPEEDVQVNIVFMIALNESHSQVEMLQQLVELIQNKNFLKSILNAKGGEEIIDLIKMI
ncbi:PTS sugar transporter subunit IIA [Thermoanaerobacter wiegelii]|uniref:Putative PTS IIA-like nitrogen-regulatory protein PtsN n=1 Tax=Thermoanaerobacter wiegelii Rt8.B1 TaxID=697303 RepID=G2MRV1_9THEO|nr:PTS sugar transporter subunit IIA [Thermoanaerobacter wiegelii]AEM77697.1 putative PTS IIA-like nitrogen-regulatory protein PtsN [Thermoanaerobacter wiegelii Rt8.B1]